MNKVYLQQMLRDCADLAVLDDGQTVHWSTIEKQCVLVAQALTIADLYKRLARNATSAEYSLYCWEHHDKWEVYALNTASGDPEINAALGHNNIPLPPQYR